MLPDDAPPPGSLVPKIAARLAPIFFWLAFFNLLLVAGVFHRAAKPDADDLELGVLWGSSLLLWPIFVGEATFGLLRRDHSQPLRRYVRRVVLIAIFPPMRMGLPEPSTGLIWLPRLGWQARGKDVSTRLEKGFSAPMLIFALMILPVLGVEAIAADYALKHLWFGIALNAAIAAIWVAFALEFILKVSVASNPFKFIKARWVDLLIVILPALEFFLTYWSNSVMLARLLRLTRASDQVAKYGRAYRMRGVMAKGWQALLAMEALARLTGETPQKRLRKLQERIRTAEEELAELHRKEEDLRRLIALDDVSELPKGAAQPTETPFA